MSEEMAAVDSATEGQSIERHFTQADVDAIVKRRIDKQNAKHAEEMAQLNAALDEAKSNAQSAAAERDALKASAQKSEWAAAAAKEYGVPSTILRGDTEEEIAKHAQEIAAEIGKNRAYPQFKDSGSSAGQATPSEKNDFVKQLFSRN